MTGQPPLTTAELQLEQSIQAYMDYITNTSEFKEIYEQAVTDYFMYGYEVAIQRMHTSPQTSQHT